MVVVAVTWTSVFVMVMVPCCPDIAPVVEAEDCADTPDVTAATAAQIVQARMFDLFRVVCAMIVVCWQIIVWREPETRCDSG